MRFSRERQAEATGSGLEILEMQSKYYISRPDPIPK